jgi:heptosyltransferase II
MKYDQKILVIRFSSIGDIVLATSPLRTLRINYPTSEITFLTLDVYAPLLHYHPDIDVLITIRKNSSIFTLFSYSKYLNQKNFTMIFDFHNSLRSKIVTIGSKSKLRKLIKPRMKRFLLFYLFYNRFDKLFSVPRMYHFFWENNFDDNKIIPKTFLKLSKNEINSSFSTLKSYRIKKSFIAIIPGAAWKQKCWGINKYIQLIKIIDFPVVLLGSKSDSICFKISKNLKRVINLAGKTNLREAMGILSNAHYVIGSDTGLTHIAEALGKNVSMILGPTSFETGANVILEKSKTIKKDIWCRPCSQNGKRKCYRTKQFCMDLITVKDVFETIPK